MQILNKYYKLQPKLQLFLYFQLYLFALILLFMQSSQLVQKEQVKGKQTQKGQESHKQKQLIRKIIKKQASSNHSLAPDILTGWHSRTLKHKLRQFPLVFTSTTTDYISKTLTSFGSNQQYRVVYMGLRPSSNMKIFKTYSQSNSHKFVSQSCLYSKQTIKKFHFTYGNETQKYFPIRPYEYRLFIGVNPTSKVDDLRFSSQFQGGNLDTAIFINKNEYDLLMRVDSNTKGHTSWFFFKVFNITEQRKVKFNIINFSKPNLLYLEGMRPYVYRTSQGNWTQQGISVQFKTKVTRYPNQFNQFTTSKFLTFTYQFAQPHEEVYFCYCIPYSYSYLLFFIQQMKKKHPQFIQVNNNHESSGGIQIPIITITNFTNLHSHQSNEQFHKKKCLATARLHPGQSQGSWMMEGFVKYLLSPQAHFLRDKMIFKIIPMVNVDGVVLGNFRTGISGRDLNRVFASPDQYKQVLLIRNLAQAFRPELYIDFHGHSAKKNVFLYGPEYKIQDRDYISCRLFAKFISKKTQAFRYYACLFKVSQCKKNTARAIMLQQYNTRFAYTIQASTFAYGSKKQLKLFSQQKYLQIGKNIAQGLHDFVKYLIRLPKRLQIKQMQQNIKLQHQQKERTKIQNKNQTKNQNKNQNKLNKKVQKIKYIQKMMEQFNYFSNFSAQDIQKQLLEQIFKSQKQKINQLVDSIHQTLSDSDCQNQQEDYSQQQLARLQQSENFKELSVKQVSKNAKQRKNKYQNLQKLKKLKKLKNKSSQMTLDPKYLPSIQNSLLLKSQIKKQKKVAFHTRQLQEKLIEIKKHRKQKYNRMNRLQSQLSFPDQFKNRKIHEIKLDGFQSWKSQQVKNNQHKIRLQASKYNQIKFKESDILLPSLKEKQSSSYLLPKRKLHRVFSQKKQKLEPVLLIRKSFMPNTNSLKLQNNSLQVQNQQNTQKSIISQILNLHQKRRKNKKQQIKILHLQS